MKIVLTYHSVADTPLSVTPTNFQRQMAYLAKQKQLEVVKLSQLFETDKPQVSITFDDCFDDCISNAIPTLLKYKFPATFFAVPGYDDKILWGSAEFQRWSNEATDEFNIPYTFMSTSQRQLIHQLGFEIGAHTLTHRNLDELDYFEQDMEINGSIQQLERELCTKIVSFCFPRGRYNETTTLILSNHPDIVNICYTTPEYAISNKKIYRFGISNDFSVFKSILAGNKGKRSIFTKLTSKISK